MKKMYKAKIFEVSREYIDHDQSAMKTVFHDYTEWEEIDQETKWSLEQWIDAKNSEYHYGEGIKRFILIIESEIDIKRALSEYIEKAKQENAKRKEKEEKYAARQEKSRAMREARKLEKARKLLEDARVKK